MSISPLHQSFRGGSGAIGVLLCHGFTGSPYALRDWADDLVAAGHRVGLPRLPGHGTAWQDLKRMDWTEWYLRVEHEYQYLRSHCDQVVVGALSMGGALALRLAEEHPDVAGLLLVNPAVASYSRLVPLAPALRFVMPSVGAIDSDIAKPGVKEHGYTRTPVGGVAAMHRLWKVVRRDIAKVEAPLLLFRSRTDHIVPERSARFILDGVSSAVKVERFLPNSYHVATLDWDAPSIFVESRDFIGRVAQAPVTGV